MAESFESVSTRWLVQFRPLAVAGAQWQDHTWSPTYEGAMNLVSASLAKQPAGVASYRIVMMEATTYYPPQGA